jgi:sugar lactone lactonase YvrE
VGVAVDASDNVYVADFANSNVRKITSGGVVTTIAVPGVSYTPFSTGFPTTYNYASNPWGVAIDASGNLIVTDNTLDVVQQITPAGVITTVAGSDSPGLDLGPIPGSSDGTGISASFNKPTGVAIDASGNIFVADYGNNTVRKIAPGGVVTTLAGTLSSGGSSDGLATAASFKGPEGIAIDGSGDVFVADTENNTIRKITPAGSVSTYAGTAGVSGSSDGTGPAAQFARPIGVAADGAGNLFVGDSGNSLIRKIAAGGVVTTFAGTAGVNGWTDGQGGAALFNEPSGIAIDANGNIYVADSGNDTIRKITSAGSVTTLAGMPAGESGVIEGPAGAAAQFFIPAAVAVDASGNVYVSDTYDHEIRKVTPAGLTTTLAGSPSGAGSADGTGAAAQFFSPQGIAVDGNGNVYVDDSLNGTIRRVTPGGVVTTLAGSAQSSGSADGTGSGAQFNEPCGIAADSVGNIYVADTGNNAIRFGVLAGNAWLSNLSARALVQGGQNLLIAGFVTTGPGDKSVLIRADGPALAAFGIANFLSDPQLTLLDSAGATVATAISWSPGLSPTFAQLGAFSLAPGSHDAALLETLSPGNYTAEVGSSSSKIGVAIAEIYDADSTAPTNRLVNISARALVGTSANVLIGGFVIGGTADETVLIRGSGPALAAFGLSGTLAAPVLTLLNSAGAIIATNAGWGNPCTLGSGAVPSGPGATTVEAATPSVFTKVGAFSLATDSADSAMVITLPPGIYTAEVSGANGGTGIGLVEIYEVP